MERWTGNWGWWLVNRSGWNQHRSVWMRSKTSLHIPFQSFSGTMETIFLAKILINEDLKTTINSNSLSADNMSVFMLHKARSLESAELGKPRPLCSDPLNTSSAWNSCSPCFFFPFVFSLVLILLPWNFIFIFRRMFIISYSICCCFY